MAVPVVIVRPPTPVPELDSERPSQHTIATRSGPDPTQNPNFLYPRWRPRSAQRIFADDVARDAKAKDAHRRRIVAKAMAGEDISELLTEKAHKKIQKLAMQLAQVNAKMGIRDQSLQAIIQEAVAGKPVAKKYSKPATIVQRPRRDYTYALPTMPARQPVPMIF